MSVTKRLAWLVGIGLFVALPAFAEPPSADGVGCRVSRNGVVSRIPDLLIPCAAHPGSRVARHTAFAPLDRGRALIAWVVALPLAALPALVVPRGRRFRAPLVVFHVCLAGIAWLGLAGANGQSSERLEAAVWSWLPAALVHLLLVFPAPRPLLARVPRLTRLPYVGAGVAMAIAWSSLEGGGLVWTAVSGTLQALSVALGVWLVLACLVHWREGALPLERVRARTLLIGAPIAAVAATALVRGIETGALDRGLLLWLGLVSAPVLLATSRYSLFDLRHDLGRVVWVLGGAGLVAVAITGGLLLLDDAAARGAPAGVVFAAALLGAVGMAAGRASLRAFRAARASSPASGWLDDLAGCTSEPEVAGQLAGRLAGVLRVECVSVFGVADGAVTPLAARGARAPVACDLGQRGIDLLGEGRSAALFAWPDGARRRAGALVGAGIDLVLALRFGGETVGVVLVGVRGEPHPNRVDLAGAETAAAQAAAHLAHGRLVQGLLEAERRASAGRTAVDLAHDLGKELAWIHRIAGRAAEGVREGGRLQRDLRIIADLAEERATALREFVHAAVAGVVEPPGRTPLVALVSRCADAAARRTGRLRPVCVLAPEARQVQVDLGAGLALGNLLDNACRASPVEVPVAVHASRAGDRLRIEVRDEGVGLPPGSHSRAFVPGFTTRHGEGSGAGLALAREAARACGGSLALEPARGGGTRATLELPA